jgi:hypothetical protein
VGGRDVVDFLRGGKAFLPRRRKSVRFRAVGSRAPTAGRHFLKKSPISALAILHSFSGGYTFVDKKKGHNLPKVAAYLPLDNGSLIANK